MGFYTEWMGNYQNNMKRIEYNKSKVIHELACLSDDEFEALLDLAKKHSVEIKRKRLTEQLNNIENELNKIK